MAGPFRIHMILVVVCAMAAPSAAQPLRRATIWDLKIGAPIVEQPPPSEFRGFACGSNGGPPRAPLTGWTDFNRCPAEPDGLHEVYFEYDDELEYIARAHDNDREISRWAGTHEVTFPVITSALFDDTGVLKGVRMVTDARPEHRNDITEANRRKREEAYTLGGVMAARFNIDAARDCQSVPPAEGETPVGSLFVKQVCERKDTAAGRRIVLRVNLFRKPGQSGYNPQLPTQLTQGQFESSARVEIYRLGPSDSP
ncbi:MAG TPA: hypothetical protein VKP67_13910 [Xanthobacteraceae bacterium]|nr:hypothetical protein [Xanthobacteraceae bacterium]